MPVSHLDFLQNKLAKVLQKDYPKHSRLHSLQHFSSLPSQKCYIKREDELGFGISGFKVRKYRTLIPYLLENRIKEAVLIGGAFSNNTLSLVQLLIENSIQPTLFLKEPQPYQNKGNFLLTQLFVETSSIHWIPKDQWPSVMTLVQAYAKGHKDVFIIPEGSAVFSSFLGSLTLALDILKNEQEYHLSFDHLFMDVGTGYSAAAVLLAFAFLGRTTTFHLLQVAGNSESFLENLRALHQDFEKWLGLSCPFPTHFHLFPPSLAPSFGSTNQKLFNFIKKTAQSEGFFLDPIYSAKLFYEAREHLKSDPSITGDILFIHSGGSLSLFGFQDRLEKAL